MIDITIIGITYPNNSWLLQSIYCKNHANYQNVVFSHFSPSFFKIIVASLQQMMLQLLHMLLQTHHLNVYNNQNALTFYMLKINLPK